MPYAGSLCWPAGFLLLYDPAAQATRKGWPYYIRADRAAPQAVVYSRATPCGWPALSTCDGEPAYGIPCGWPALSTCDGEPAYGIPCGWPALSTCDGEPAYGMP